MRLGKTYKERLAKKRARYDKALKGTLGWKSVAIKKFAILPKRMDNGSKVWLESYWEFECAWTAEIYWEDAEYYTVRYSKEEYNEQV